MRGAGIGGRAGWLANGGVLVEISAEGRGEHLNTFLSTKGREGARRTATATSFCPRRATKDHEERQLQLLFVHEGPLRATKGREERQLQLLFVHEGPLRATKDHEERLRQLLFVHEGPLRATKGREERLRQLLFVHEGPLRATKNGYGNFFLSTKGR